MEANELTIKLEQRDWERLQQLSERNGEPMERLAARLLAAYLAKILVKPPDVVISPEARKIRDAFIAGRTQLKPMEDKILTPTEAVQTKATQNLQLTK